MWDLINYTEIQARWKIFLISAACWGNFLTVILVLKLIIETFILSVNNRKHVIDSNRYPLPYSSISRKASLILA